MPAATPATPAARLRRIAIPFVMIRGAEAATAPSEGGAGFYPRSSGRGDAGCGQNGGSEVVHCRAGGGLPPGVRTDALDRRRPHHDMVGWS